MQINSIQIKNFKYACECFFNDGELRKLLEQRLKELEIQFTKIKNKNNEDKNNEDDISL